VPQHVELSRVLKRILPNLEVVNRDLGAGVFGRYDPATGALELNTKAMRSNPPAGAVTALLHEGLHGATVDYVHRIFNTPEISLSSREVSHKIALRAISDEIYRVVNDHNIPMAGTERRSVGYATREYTGGAPHEIITQVFTDPGVARVLSQTKASPQLKAMLDSVGLGSRGVSSLWDAFKRTVRQIFGLPGNDSVLDHVFRPLAEITETGGRYRAEMVKARAESVKANRDVLEVRPELRDELSLKNLRAGVGDALDPAKRQGVRKLFEFGTLHAIHDFMKPLTPSVTAHRDAVDAVTAASVTERMRQATTHGLDGRPISEAHTDKVQRLHDELVGNKDLGQLMTDATMARADLLDAAKNDHLRTPAELNRLAELQQKFDALTPREKQTYAETNELLNEWHRVEQDAKVTQFVEASLPDLSRAEQQAVIQQMHTRAGVEAVLQNPDMTALAQQLGARWPRARDLVAEVAGLRDAGGWVEGNYFGLRRYGEYVLTYGEPGKPGYGVEMFERPSQAGARRDELLASGRQDVSQVFIKSQVHRSEILPDRYLGTLDNALAKAGIVGDQAKVIRDLYAGQMIQQGTRMATNQMRREYIAGASTDHARNLMADFMAHTSRLGHLKHGGEVQRSMLAIEKEAKDLHQPGTTASRAVVMAAGMGAQELRRRLAPPDGDTSADTRGMGVRGLTTASALYALVRPAHLVMQLVGSHTAGASLIAARHGMVSSQLALARAVAQLSGTAAGAGGRNAMAAARAQLRAANWEMSTLYRNRLKATDMDNAHVDLLIDRMDQAGLINHTQMREMQRMAGGYSAFGLKLGYIARAMDAFGAGEHAIDSMMRTAIAKAAFETEFRRNGRHVNEALDYAMQMARDAMPDFNFHNKPRFTTGKGAFGAIGPLVSQFKSFGLHMYGVQGNLLARAVRNPAERAEALKAIAYLQGSHAVLWGGIGASLFGSLPAMAGMGLYDMLFGEPGLKRPRTNQEMLTGSRNWVASNTNQTFADVYANGIGMAFGVDMHKSLQFTNPLGVPELKTWTEAGALEFLSDLAGPSFSVTSGVVGGLMKVAGGDWRMTTISQLLPRIIGDPIRGVAWGNEGVKDARGSHTILPAEKISAADVAAQALGFRASSISRAQEGRNAIYHAEEVAKDIKIPLLDRLVQAKPADRKAVIAEITRYNRANPLDPITGQAIQARLRDQARANAMPDLYGAHVARRAIQQRTELTRFANP